MQQAETPEAVTVLTDSMQCAISFVIMTSGVVAADGHSYQQAALEQHIANMREGKRDVA